MGNGKNNYPKTATFIENGGTRYPNKTPLKIGNVWVIGHDTGSYVKMVSFDVYGNQVESRYMRSRKKINEKEWK
jgi:hypothetical protein